MGRFLHKVSKNVSLQKNVAWLLAIVMIITVAIPAGASVFAAVTSVQLSESQGWLESAYVEWTSVTGMDGYHVYYKSATDADTSYQQIDDSLIRQYSDYYRADVLGLSAGQYVIKVVPVANGTEQTDKQAVSSELTVLAQTREGFAFSEESSVGTGSGGYNDDGTVADDAQILYVTEENKDTIQADVITNSKGTLTTCTGIGDILTKRQKGYDTRPLIIRIIGMVTPFSTSANEDYMQIKKTSNVTLEGIGEDATAYGWGVLVRACTNVEVRNLGFMMFPDDGISLDTDNSNIWIHNNDIFYGAAGSDSDQEKGDGSCDIKSNSTYVTVSYNHFWDSGKSSLCGMSDTEEFFVTYHHNWFDHSDSRHARIRVATVHLYNNYFDGNAKYGVGVTKGSSAFVENNYFRNCKYPMLSSLQGTDIYYGTANATFSSENGGMIKAYGNTIIGATRFVSQTEDSVQFDAYVATSKEETVPEDYTTVAGGTTYNNFDTASTMYTYTPDTAEEAVVKVQQYAGRINGGDFQWTFDESDDTSSDLDTELKAAIVSYTSSLVSVGGEDETSGNVSATEITATTKTAEATTVAETTTATTTAETTADTTVVSTNTDYVQNFTENGMTSDFYTISGNLSTHKGTVSYNGLTLTTCLKMESATSITFTAPSDGTLKLIFLGSESGKKTKVNGTKYTSDDNGMLEVAVSSGSITVTKGDSCNLFYMVFIPSGNIEIETETETESQKTEADTTGSTTESTTESATESTTESSDGSENGSSATESVTGMVTNISTIQDSQLAYRIYCAPDASETGVGTQNDPMTLENAIDLASETDGIAILLMSGTYAFDSQITIPYGNNGTVEQYKVLRAAEGATVTLDFSGEEYGDTSTNARGLQLEGNYWYVGGITITGAADNGMFVAGNYNIVERCVCRANRDSGLQISRRNSTLSDMADWPSYNYIINCTSFDNMDPATNENADGFACKLTAGPGNIFDGCISYCNIDDGWDLYAKAATGSIGVVTIRNCVSFCNGSLTDGTTSTAGDRNGFKLGGSNGKVPTAHIVFNCLSFLNGKDGFTDNGNGASLTVTNCTSYANDSTNFNFYRTTSGGTFSNLISVAASGTDKFIGTLENCIYYNSKKYYHITSLMTVASGDKTGTVVSEPADSDFKNMITPDVDENVDSTLRSADGTIDMNGYLETSNSSNYALMGAKFGGQTETMYINVAVTTGGEISEPVTEATTEEVTTEEVTTEGGEVTENAAAVVIAADQIVTSDQMDIVVTESTESDITVAVSGAPTIQSTLLEHILSTGKNVTVQVTDENRQLLYSWTFDGKNMETAAQTAAQTITQTIDTAITFSTDCCENLKNLINNEAALFITFTYHGELPGPTTISLYVGNQYTNGSVLYLYYYNEDKESIEVIDGSGITVVDGYVTFTLTHCSLYFLSENETLLGELESEINSNNESETESNISNNERETDSNEEETEENASDTTQTTTQTLDLNRSALFVIVAIVSVMVFCMAGLWLLDYKKQQN